MTAPRYCLTKPNHEQLVRSVYDDGYMTAKKEQDYDPQGSEALGKVLELLDNPYENLSHEAKETAITMIAFCIERGYCMGMGEGFENFETGKRTPEIQELIGFLKQVPLA